MVDDSSSDIDRILDEYHSVAIVGASPDPERPSYKVAEFLKGQGYRVIPVTPKADRVVGETAYRDLASIPEPVDVVDVFRRPEEVPAVVEEAIAIGAKAVWMQLGIVNEQAAERARKAGLTVVMDRCMKKETERRRGLLEQT